MMRVLAGGCTAAVVTSAPERGRPHGAECHQAPHPGAQAEPGIAIRELPHPPCPSVILLVKAASLPSPAHARLTLLSIPQSPKVITTGGQLVGAPADVNGWQPERGRLFAAAQREWGPPQ